MRFIVKCLNILHSPLSNHMILCIDIIYVNGFERIDLNGRLGAFALETYDFATRY